MEYWLLYVVVQLLLAPFTYKHYQKVLSETPQPKGKRVLQSDKYKTQKPITPLSKQGLKPSRPTPEPPLSGVQMVGGKAVLIKAPTSPVLPPPVVDPAVKKTAVPPPPPPSIHSKLNPVKTQSETVTPYKRVPTWAKDSEVIPATEASVQRTPTPIPKKPSIDVPARVLLKLDSYTYDRAISQRLVMNVAKKNPDRDGTWCAEKALWDIERDRQ